jgi:hypothetical protein
MADNSDFTNLTKAAKGNHIRLKDDAAKKCAQMCVNLIDELDTAIKDADSLATVTGFGNLKDAEELAKRYSDLAGSGKDGGDSSLKHALERHRAVVSDMKDTFVAAGRAYLENEDATAGTISKAVSDYEAAIGSLKPQPPSQW